MRIQLIGLGNVGRSFKDALNEAIRDGWAEAELSVFVVFGSELNVRHIFSQVKIK